MKQDHVYTQKKNRIPFSHILYPVFDSTHFNKSKIDSFLVDLFLSNRKL
jgi:hypothetical protein